MDIITFHFIMFMSIISKLKDLFIIKERTTYIKGLVSPNSPSTPLSTQDTDLSLMRKMYDTDPLVKSCIKARINYIMKSGYEIKSKNKTTKKKFEDFFKRVRFSRLLRQILHNLLIYGNAFVEIEYAPSGVIKNLYIIDTETVRIITDKNGVVISYRQESPNGVVELPPENVWHIGLNFDSDIWGEVDLKTLSLAVASKQFIEKLIAFMFSTNQFREMFKVDKMNDENIKKVISYYKRYLEVPEMPFIASGELEREVIRKFDELKSLPALLDYFRSQILSMLLVPPIIVGLPDNSNRSNAEIQLRMFNSVNESYRNLIADEINYELIPMSGYGSAEFVWKPIDKRNEKDDVEIAERLFRMGAKPDKLEQFLREAGLKLPEGEFFDRSFYINNKQSRKSYPMDLYPSRKKEDKTELPKHNVGEESSTREEQLLGKTFNSYPYTYESLDGE